MLRRLKKGNLKLSCAIQNNEAKDKFNRLWKSQKIVVYDDCPVDHNSNPSNVVDLLVRKLKQDGANAVSLSGVYSFFEIIVSFKRSIYGKNV